MGAVQSRGRLTAIVVMAAFDALRLRDSVKVREALTGFVPLPPNQEALEALRFGLGCESPTAFATLAESKSSQDVRISLEDALAARLWVA